MQNVSPEAHQELKAYCEELEAKIRAYATKSEDVFVIHCESRLHSTHGENRFPGYVSVYKTRPLLWPTLAGAYILTKDGVDDLVTKNPEFLGEHKVFLVKLVECPNWPVIE